MIPMTPDERCDELAANLIRCYRAIGETAVVIRTHGKAVSTILPNGDKALIATVLRLAADSIENHAN